MFHDKNVTTVNRVSTLFLLPHAIGHRALLFHPEDGDHVLCMIAQAQMMIIACRGRRSYTEDELRSIYDHGFIVFFQQVELLRARAHERNFESRRSKHVQNPEKNPKPRAFKRKSRWTRVTHVLFIKFNTRFKIMCHACLRVCVWHEFWLSS